MPVIFILYNHTFFFHQSTSNQMHQSSPLKSSDTGFHSHNIQSAQKFLSLHLIPRALQICNTRAPAKIRLHVLPSPTSRLYTLSLMAFVCVYYFGSDDPTKGGYPGDMVRKKIERERYLSLGSVHLIALGGLPGTSGPLLIR